MGEGGIESQFIIDKPKLPKGMSYPLKSSRLYNAMNDACITSETWLTYSPSPGQLFTAMFGLYSHSREEEGFYLSVYAVPVELAQEARRQMEEEAIPSFITWAKYVLNLPEDSTKRDLRSLRFYREFRPPTA